MSVLRGHRIERPWGRMRVWEAGAGPRTVLAIHGLGGSGRYYARLTSALGDEVRIVAPDFAGFGTSDKPDIGYERGSHLDDLAAVAERFELAEPFAVVGHSLGGLLGALWTARDTSRVSGLAVMSAPYPSADGTEIWLQEPKLPPAARVAAPFLKGLVRVLAIPVGVARGYPPAVAADYARQTFRSRGRTMWSALYDPAVLAELEQVRALDGRLPILVEHADEDRTVPLSAHTKWSELLPSAEHRIVHGGHQVQLHERFASLASWLGRLPR